MGLNRHDSVSLQREERHRHTSRDGHMKSEAEAEGGWPPPEAGRGRKAPPLDFREHGPVDTLTGCLALMRAEPVTVSSFFIPGLPFSPASSSISPWRWEW